MTNKDEGCWFCGGDVAYEEQRFTLGDVSRYAAETNARLAGSDDALARKLATESVVFQNLDEVEAGQEFVLRAACDTGACYRRADDDLRSSIRARSYGWNDRELGTLLYYGLIEVRSRRREQQADGPMLPPFCALCQADLPREGACPKHPTGLGCERIYRPVPREAIVVEAGEPCRACGLAVPVEAYMFVCSKHPDGGWCFSEQDVDRNAVRRRELEVERTKLIARWPSP